MRGFESRLVPVQETQVSAALLFAHENELVRIARHQVPSFHRCLQLFPRKELGRSRFPYLKELAFPDGSHNFLSL